MAGFERELLHFFALDPLRKYSEDFVPLDGNNPFRFRLNGVTYSIHISFIHDSGANRDNDDEVRIQISRAQIDLQKTRAACGEVIGFLGFFREGDVFVGWDPAHVLSLQAKTVVSVYARQSMYRRVGQYKVDTHEFRSIYLKSVSRAIALPSFCLGFYLENLANFHALSSESQIVEVLEEVQADLTTLDPDPLEGTDRKRVREKFTLLRTAYRRDPRFRALVLDAYRYACCICGVQLDLVQAAHIVPHALPESVDEVRNGLALCANHHRLYDDGLLVPSPGGVLLVNERRARYLESVNRAFGLEDIKSLHGASFLKPIDPKLHPDEGFLEKGMAFRMV